MAEFLSHLEIFLTNLLKTKTTDDQLFLTNRKENPRALQTVHQTQVIKNPLEMFE